MIEMEEKNRKILFKGIDVNAYISNLKRNDDKNNNKNNNKNNVEFNLLVKGIENYLNGKEKFEFYMQILKEYEEKDKTEEVFDLYSQMIKNISDYRESEEYKNISVEDKSSFLNMAESVVFGNVILKIMSEGYIKHTKTNLIELLNNTQKILLLDIVKNILNNETQAERKISVPIKKISMRIESLISEKRKNRENLLNLEPLDLANNEKEDLYDNIKIIGNMLSKIVKTNEDIGFKIRNEIDESSETYIFQELLKLAGYYKSSFTADGELISQQDFAGIINLMLRESKKYRKGIDSAYVNGNREENTSKYVVRVDIPYIQSELLMKNEERISGRYLDDFIDIIKRGLFQYVSNSVLVKDVKFSEKMKFEWGLSCTLNKHENLVEIFKGYENIIYNKVMKEFENYSSLNSNTNSTQIINNIKEELLKKEREVLLAYKLIEAKDISEDKKIRKKI